MSKSLLLQFLFRDSLRNSYSYECIACIEFMGEVNKDGVSKGHYICNVREPSSGKWFRTNDNKKPEQILLSEVSKKSHIALYKRK